MTTFQSVEKRGTGRQSEAIALEILYKLLILQLLPFVSITSNRGQ
jgi:hypothetical protein